MAYANAATNSVTKRIDAELVRSRWCSETWSMSTVNSRGTYAFHRLLTFSKSLGLTLCGMVDEPTTSVFGSVALRSRSSRISLRWRLRPSSARFAMTPQQDVRVRSEERRVGKECGARVWVSHG